MGIPSPLNHFNRGSGPATRRTSDDGTYLQGYAHPHSYAQPAPAYPLYSPPQHAPVSSSMPMPSSTAIAAPMPINPLPATPHHLRAHAHNWGGDGMHMEHDGGANAEIQAKLGGPQSAVSDTIMS